VREQQKPEDVVLIGFGSYKGTVIVGRGWGAPMQVMHVPPAREGSVEEVLHAVSAENKLLIFDDNSTRLKDEFEGWLGHRAIGVVYYPERERGNYVPSILTERYDAFLYIDKTSALHPLHMNTDGRLTLETFPFGI
jgi:erythromycin esterase